MKETVYKAIESEFVSKEFENYEDISPIYHAVDIYDTLRHGGATEKEALKIAEIACRNEWDKQKCRRIDALIKMIDEIKEYI